MLGWSPAIPGELRPDVGAGPAQDAGDDGPQADRNPTRFVIDARIAPFSAIGRLAGVVICTGSLVLDPRIVVTAAHCVVERDGSLTRSTLTFQPGYQPGSDGGSFTGDVWAVGSLRQYMSQTAHDAASDWAIIVLDQPPDDIRPLGLQEYGKNSDGPLEGILLPSYGKDMSDAQVLTVDLACSVTEIVWEVLLHDCAASHGASGAPLLVRDGFWYAVIGINSGAIALPVPRHRQTIIRNSAVGSRFFSAAIHDVHERLRDGLGPGCRYQWSGVHSGVGGVNLRTC